MCYVGTNNNVLRVAVVNVSSSTDVQLQCTLLSGFTGSAHCTVQYGTDPTYMNLPYSAESTETGTAGDTVSVVLRERLNSSTVYYYTVSAVSEDITMTVEGTLSIVSTVTKQNLVFKVFRNLFCRFLYRVDFNEGSVGE